MRIYGLDVKDRVRKENHPKYARDRQRPSMARGCGANDTLATRYRVASVLKFKNYFVNFKVLRFNSTFTFLPNTNLYPLTLVRPI